MCLVIFFQKECIVDVVKIGLIYRQHRVMIEFRIDGLILRGANLFVYRSSSATLVM